MKVRVLTPFVCVVHGLAEQGQIVDLPPGADWLKAGLVERVTNGKGKQRRSSSGSSNEHRSEGVDAG